MFYAAPSMLSILTHDTHKNLFSVFPSLEMTDNFIPWNRQHISSDGSSVFIIILRTKAK